MDHAGDIEIAVLAAAYISRDERRLNGLLETAGMTLGDAKQAIDARSYGFFAHVFAYLLSSEPWAREFAQEHDLAPEDLAAAARPFGIGGLMDG